MFASRLTPLLSTLHPHFHLSKTRLETLAVLLVGLANCRTVNLSHLASQFPGPALHSSNYRRLQRFFQHVQLDGDTAARLIPRLSCGCSFGAPAVRGGSLVIPVSSIRPE